MSLYMVIGCFVFFSYDMESATLKPPDDIVEAAKKWFVNTCPDVSVFTSCQLATVGRLSRPLHSMR